MALSIRDFFEYVDYSNPSLWVSAASVAFNPLFWNIVARQEYHNKLLTKLFGGNSKAACYALAATIFSLGMVRDFIYKNAIAQQPSHPALLDVYLQAFAVTLFIVGNVLVVSSTWRLGITGTFLGDYFGILLDEMVTGFPFNVTGSPMYTGSTYSFLATAIWYGKPAGVLLTLWVHFVYKLALKYEDPFTSEIYAKRERERATSKKSN
ncbi:hypothetical protein F66182_6904 [Fusarium sp. NRRL 66182]|nr:hypothetical protein F66182_6904 [Fusarium sp. NRRL 66182]